MRAGMGNLLETDSDVASISDNEKERTDGDGMESDSIADARKFANANCTAGDGNHTKSLIGPDKTIDSGSSSTASGLHRDPSIASLPSLPYTSKQGELSRSSTNNSISEAVQLSETNRAQSVSEIRVSEGSPAPSASAGRLAISSPRELPPRSQLIQLKPTFRKARISSSNSTEASPEGLNKQKNPKFVPYEPYRGAVRPMVTEDDGSKQKHSRTGSEASCSNSVESVIQSLTLDSGSTANNDQPSSVAQGSRQNTQSKLPDELKVTEESADLRVYKQDQIILKQTHALTLFKERLKIAEKDNNDLHKENTRLKKMLVDSLSGDLFQSKPEIHPDSSERIHAANESVDALSNEIEVWRSKFLSSCVLVEQLTRENGILHESVGSAASIFKNLKLSNGLSNDEYEVINAWLRINRISPLQDDPNSSEQS